MAEIYLMNYVIFNGTLLDEREAYISPHDRGFRHGDGIFDTMLVNFGRIYQLPFHLDRLKAGLAAIRINFDVTVLHSMFQELLIANRCENCLLRVQITRGIGGRGYLPEGRLFPTLLIETMNIPVPPTEPVSLMISKYQKISPQSLPVNFKLCQGLNSTLARMEAADNSCFDALLLDNDGNICETSSANIFWLKNNVLYTPSLECGVLGGSIRSAVIRFSPYRIEEVAASVADIISAEAVFITNVSYKILAISELKGLGTNYDSKFLTAQIFHLLETDIARKTLN